MKKNVIIYSAIAVIFLVLLCLYIPLAKKDLQIKGIKKDIQRVEAQIELNKTQRANCDANMKLWNEENDANRQMLEELKEKYNDMVGFTEA